MGIFTNERVAFRARFWLALAPSFVAFVGCGDDGTTRTCEPGSTQLCVCPGGVEGAQTCADDGARWEVCDCGGADADADADADGDADADADADADGDADADADADGDVEAEADSPAVCPEAPGCGGAVTPGTIETPLESLASSDPPTGCEPTKLRARLASVTVYDAQDAPESDEIYCVTSARAPTGGEIRLLPVTASLGDGASFDWPVEAGVLWGQAIGPAVTEGTLEVVVDCLEQDDPAGLEDFAARLADEAALAGGVATDSGWLFPAGTDVATVVVGTPWPPTDDFLFSATVAIEEGVQFAATRGAWTALRRSGGAWPSEWDWEVRLEVWGCTDNGTLPR